MDHPVPRKRFGCGTIIIAAHMVIEEEILARIRAAKVWDKDARLEDFQLQAAENGCVLINLKTRRAQLLYDEDSELHDLEQLCPGNSKRCRPLL